MLKRLSEIRNARGLTQKDLGSKSGINPTQIGHFESGERSPNLDNLIRLADGLGVSLDYLVGRGTGAWQEGYRRGAFDARESMKAATLDLCKNLSITAKETE